MSNYTKHTVSISTLKWIGSEWIARYEVLDSRGNHVAGGQSTVVDLDELAPVVANHVRDLVGNLGAKERLQEHVNELLNEGEL